MWWKSFFDEERMTACISVSITPGENEIMFTGRSYLEEAEQQFETLLSSIDPDRYSGITLVNNAGMVTPIKRAGEASLDELQRALKLVKRRFAGTFDRRYHSGVINQGNTRITIWIDG